MTQHCHRLVGWLLCAGVLAGYVPWGRAETFTISTPGGSVEIEISHTGPSGSLVTPGEPQGGSFRPPTIFSAPMPAGSGARALGFAGAFTAVADDATAASWNPAGLVQLERPEASFMVRYSTHDTVHYSSSGDFQVGDDRYNNFTLNYVSAVVPLCIGEHMLVCSINFQEAYDFEQRFTAAVLGQSSRTEKETSTQLYTDTQVDHFDDGTIELDVTSHITTRLNSYLSQLLSSDMLSGLEFEQEGIIDAITPAFAFEITPKVCAGWALNIYGDDTMGGHAIRSLTTARYTGTSGSRVTINDTRTTSGSYAYSGTWTVPGIEILPGIFLPPTEVPISGSGTYDPFSDVSSSGRNDSLVFDGVYTEENEFSDLSGFNATFGLLWFVSRQCNVAMTVDLPWTAHAVQTKTIGNTITTYDGSHSTVLNVSESKTVEEKNVEFRFPTYVALGGLWRWNNVLSSCVDVSQTRWSEFHYRAGNDEPLNPLDGSTYGANPVADCWAAKYGMEYLMVLSNTEVPFRCGVSWEQRPAIGDPDEFVGFSVGTGISIGRDPGKLILDVAYNYMQGNDVLKSLVPDQQGLSTDATEHQVYFSGIWHF